MELVRALQYTQPVAILVFTDADVALRYWLAAPEFGRRERLCWQFVNITRLHAT